MDSFAKRGARAAAVTLGDPEETLAFCGARAPGVLCLTDPGQEAYRAYGLGQADMAALLAPGVVLAGAQAALEGHLPGRTVGDPLQMPGTFVIGRGGAIQLAYYGRTVADHPPLALLLGAI